ncbi:MAG: DNA repair protein RecO, partial [Nitrospinaceae bacterium]
FGAALEPLSHLSVILFGKETQELYRLSQCDILTSFQTLRENPESCFTGVYFLELVDTLTREGESDPRLFEFLLSALNQMEPLAGKVLLCRLFELRLLSLLGYKPRLNECYRCGQIPDSVWVGFRFGNQGIFCGSCQTQEPADMRVRWGTVNYLKKMLTLDIRHWRRLKVPRGLEEEMETLIRRLILVRVGRELKTYPLLQQMRFSG